MNQQNYNEVIDMNKELCSVCICGVGLQWKNQLIVMLLPCEHMFHKNCLDQKNNKCQICEQTIDRYTDMYDIHIHPQRCADLLSVSYYDDMSTNTSLGFIDSIFDLATIFTRIPLLNNKTDGKHLCERLFSMNNITMKVYGLDSVKMEKKKVFICNHTSLLELPVIYYLFGTGFLASSIVGSSTIVDHIKKIVPLLTFDRGVGKVGNLKNTVELMKDFIKEKGSICLFPEGMMTHPDTLVRFRSGAFNTGYPVYAIVIKHLDIIADGYINGFLFKFGAKKNINLEVHILGPYYPPFDALKIERVRYDMAKIGDMVLSRVSNRGIVDRKGDHV